MDGLRRQQWILCAALLGGSVASIPAATARGSLPLPQEDEGVLRGHADLAPVDGNPQPEARGTVDLRSSDRGDRLTVAVVGADPAVGLVLFVDDGTGTQVEAGVLTPRPTGVAVDFGTREGSPLPAGANSAADLVGRLLNVREAGGAPILTGAVPDLVLSPPDDGETPIPFPWNFSTVLAGVPLKP